VYAIRLAPNHFKKAREMGFDFVHSYSFEGSASRPSFVEKESIEKGIKRRVEMLDMAHEHGLKFMMGLPRYPLCTGKRGPIVALVDAIKDHPALGFWYLYDEPSRKIAKSPEFKAMLEWTRALLKEKTPHLPIMPAICWTECWRNTVPLSDALMPDQYPVRDKPFPESQLNNRMRFTEGVLATGKPVIPILQCYKIGENDRYPLPVELRCQAFASLTQKVAGLWWYGYDQGHRLPNPKYFSNTFGPVLRELKAFTDAVYPAKAMLRLRRFNDEKDIYVGYWDSPRTGRWLVVASGWPFARTTSVHVAAAIEQAHLEPWGSTTGGRLEVKDGRFRLDTQPWETFVWRVKQDSEEAALGAKGG